MKEREVVQLGMIKGC